MKGPGRAIQGPAKWHELRPVAGRLPPQDLGAEAAVLSAILLERSTLDLVGSFLNADHFYSDANRRVFEAAQSLAAEGKAVDVVSVAGRLRDRDMLHQIGGSSYLAELADATPATAHVEEHARLVVDKWRLRQLIAACHSIAAAGYGAIDSVEFFLDSAEQAIFDIARGAATKSRGVHVSVAVREAHEVCAAAVERGTRLAGISTGYRALDALTNGLKAGELIVVAGRPGMGKTAFAMSMALNVAFAGHGVCVASLEMQREQLSARAIASEAGLDLTTMLGGGLDVEELRRQMDASVAIAGLPLWIDDSPAIGVLDLRGSVRRRQAEYDRPASRIVDEDGCEQLQPGRRIAVVVVDYLQLMRGTGKEQNREQEIAQISRGLKAMAKELGVTVIALSQLNRDVEKRATKDKRPQLADIRESGAVEQDADLIVFIYRDDYYFPDSKTPGMAELIIAKQRNGATGKVLIRFRGYCTRFEDLEQGSRS